MSKAEVPRRRGGVPPRAPEPAGHEAAATATVSSWQRTAGVTLLLTAIVPVVLIAFAWPAGRAAIHDVPFGVAGSARQVAATAQRLEQARPGAFDVHRYARRPGRARCHRGT